jgi:hypothetical protein
MSDYGLVTGVDGNIQFDTNRKVLGLQEHGYASSWTEHYVRPGIYMYTHEITCNCLIAAIAVRPSFSTIVRSFTHPPRPKSYVPPIGIVQTGTDIIEYAVYSPDVNDTHAIPAWGLVTYNESGDVVFNSDVRYLKIVDIIEVNRSTLLNWGSVTISHNVQNPFYIIPDSYGGTGYLAPAPGGAGTGVLYKTLGIQKVSATSAKIEWFTIEGSPAVMGFGSEIDDFFSVPNPFCVAVCTL